MDIRNIIKNYISTKELIDYGYYININQYFQIANINDDKKYKN